MDAEVVVYLVSQKLQNLLHDEAIEMTPKVKDQAQRTIHRFNLFRHLMKEGEKNRALAVEMNNSQWTVRLLRALYSMDDAIDTFLVRKALQSQRQNGLMMICQRPLTSFFNGVTFNKLMKEFISKTEDLLKDKQQLGIQDVADSEIPGPSQRQSWGRISGFFFDDESHAVGLEEQVKKLAALVLQGADQRNQPAVVSMVGEGGSGKTAIARTVYNRLDIKRHFSSRAWVHVTKDFKVRDVLVDMITQLDEILAKEPLLEDEVKWRLFKILGQGRYLIVVDDVVTPEFWESIKEVFPPSSHGGVVIVTTRKSDVAVPAGSTLQVRPLNDEESWALFLKKLELTEDRLHDSQLIKFKEQILKSCGGLPLAVILMGGLLSAKELTDSEWLGVIENVDAIEDILALSYHELPSCLKSCFLYMGLFPKAVEIPVRRLIHLWVAEGFVTSLSDGDMVEEDLAEMYFEELVCRKIIQVVRCRLDGSPKTCRLPSVVHDFVSSKAMDIGFFQIHSKSFSAKKSCLPVRRLATYSNSPFSKLNISHLRSYLSFNTLKGGIPAGNSSMFLDKIMKKRNLGVFRALDLENVYKPQLPKAVVALLNLRYLGLRSTAINSLPVSIGALQWLETLDVKHTNITTLPDSFWKLGNLRHLYLNGICLDSLETHSVESLNKLQSLCGLSIGNESLVAETFSKFTCLRKLQLTFYLLSARSMKIDWTSQLNKLQSLRIKSIRKTGESASIKFRNLEKLDNLVNLYIFGALVIPLPSIILPPNLKSLTLSKTGMKNDPMPVLGKLPNLNILRLLNFSYIGEKMNCASGAFPQLHVLKLWQVNYLSKWVVNEGALTSLRELEIRDCRNLKRLDAIYQLTNLKELILTNMPPDAVDYARGINNAGKDVFIKENYWKPSPPMVSLPYSFTPKWTSFILDKIACSTHKHLDFAPSLNILARLMFAILLRSKTWDRVYALRRQRPSLYAYTRKLYSAFMF